MAFLAKSAGGSSEPVSTQREKREVTQGPPSRALGLGQGQAGQPGVAQDALNGPPAPGPPAHVCRTPTAGEPRGLAAWGLFCLGEG